MAQLFELDENGKIDLNKEWIRLNPKMKALLDRDEGSKGDQWGLKKRLASVDFNYIRMMWSPNSEYESFPELERRKQVLRVLEINTNKYLADTILQEAEEEYKGFLRTLRSYRAWKAATSSLDSKIDSLEKYKPDAVDKQGKLLMTPEQHTKAIKSIRDDLETVDAYKNMMDKEIAQQIDTRSTLKKGLREDRATSFKESSRIGN